MLRIGREKLSDKGTTSARKRVDPLRSQTGLSREAIIDRMVQTFQSQHGLTEGAVTPAEIVAAQQQIEERFGTNAWLEQVP